MFNKKCCTKIYIFASVLRSDPKSRPVMWRVKAASEKEARRQLVRDYVLVCAGIMPIGNREVRHD
ncbi:host cell division inhibitor Icd-like protein [Serratia fonticola]|uniref:host cell division inhibitor Icd-like protein n=1 Tax=Serratia fonticola TaxID=47917 RepID=UPI000E0E1307|nr:host cell division inhibitor Icd-like protein [Serratia fonticola]